ncbi:MAG: hypothetical protein CFE33_06855 [Pseudorhodobacter sp. PARRP1]|nr:MAG: hypothetical protein CFE33_06855 [Pseudorhodobacter sp. PARRP1]
MAPIEGARDRAAATGGDCARNAPQRCDAGALWARVRFRRGYFFQCDIACVRASAKHHVLQGVMRRSSRAI